MCVEVEVEAMASAPAKVPQAFATAAISGGIFCDTCAVVVIRNGRGLVVRKFLG